MHLTILANPKSKIELNTLLKELRLSTLIFNNKISIIVVDNEEIVNNPDDLIFTMISQDIEIIFCRCDNNERVTAQIHTEPVALF